MNFDQKIWNGKQNKFHLSHVTIVGTGIEEFPIFHDTPLTWSELISGISESVSQTRCYLSFNKCFQQLGVKATEKEQRWLCLSLLSEHGSRCSSSQGGSAPHHHPSTQTSYYTCYHQQLAFPARHLLSWTTASYVYVHVYSLHHKMCIQIRMLFHSIFYR